MDISEENKQRAKKLITHAQNPEMANFEELANVSDSLMEVAKVFKDINAVTIKGEKGEKGDQGEVGPQGESIVGPQGPKGEDAHMIGPKGDKGLDGYTPVKGVDYFDGENGKDGKDGEKGDTGDKGEDGSPDSATDIKNKLESLTKDERLDISAIKGADKLKDEIVHHAVDQSRGILYAGLLEDRANNTGGGHVIEDEGTPLAQRTNLNFVGAGVTVTDDSGNDTTVVTINGGTGSGGVGATGATGPQGPQGTQGSQGSAGNDGAVGAQGPQGSQGSAGVSGTAPGPQGTQGTQGSIGLQGATGNDGAQGIQGVQGTQGSIGIQGATGPQGSQGTIGVQGATGPQGTQGTAGSRGSQGSQGSQGTQGATGNQGTQGSIGLRGTQGSQGSLGATGGTGFVSPRSIATGSTLSPAPNADTTDVFSLIAQAGTAAFQATSGTPVEGQKLIIKIVGTGATAYAITWTGGTGGYTAGGVALPTAVVRGKVITVGFMYDTSNSINRWLCIASATQV